MKSIPLNLSVGFLKYNRYNKANKTKTKAMTYSSKLISTTYSTININNFNIKVENNLFEVTETYLDGETYTKLQTDTYVFMPELSKALPEYFYYEDLTEADEAAWVSLQNLRLMFDNIRDSEAELANEEDSDEFYDNFIAPSDKYWEILFG